MRFIPSNFMFQISAEAWIKAKSLLVQKYSAKSVEVSDRSIVDRLTITDESGKVTAIYYTTGKLLIQGRPNSAIMHSIAEDIRVSLGVKEETTKERPDLASPDEDTISKEFLIGLDEAGAGETFGSLFLGCAVLNRGNLGHIRGLLGAKNIRELTEDSVINLFNATKGLFKFRVKPFSAYDVDNYNKNILLDRGYRELLSEVVKDASKSCVIVDDYGIQYELKESLKQLEANSCQTIVAKKADETYTCVKLGSLVARKLRIEEVERINAENVLADIENGKRVLPGTGAASNPATSDWLTLYRKQYPYSDFPIWVRRKWENVKRIEEQLPKKTPDLIIHCPMCQKKHNKLLIRYDGSATTLSCGWCNAPVTKEEFQIICPKISVVVDTSALITRIVSKDIRSTGYFEGFTFIVPSLLYEELDSKQPDLKRGGQAEIEFMIANNINWRKVDVDDFRDVSKDKKFMSIMAMEGAAILTMDRTLVTFSELGHLVFEIQN